MAKQTRAQRKKQNQRAQVNQEKAAASQIIEDDSLEESSIADSAEAVFDDAAGKAAEAKQAVAEKVPSAAEERLKEREEKNRQKLVARERKAAAKAEKKAKRTKRRGPKFFWTFVDYIKAVRVEMKRVTWPTRNEVGRLSLVVVVALVFFGVLIYIVDSAVTPLLYWFSSLGG